MPTELIRASARPGSPRSNARSGNIVAIALTAALVMLQLVGLAMLERSHAQSVPPSLVKSPQTSCAESAEISPTQTPYD